jgi:hypothetical protein
VLADRFLDRLLLDLVVVLGRDDDRLDAGDATVLVADRDLGLAVGAQPVDALDLLLANLGELVRQLVRELDRHRHQLLGLVAREAKHQALVAGALLRRVGAAVNALRDIGRLRGNRHHDRARVSIKAHVRAGEPDLANRLADDRRIVELRLGGDLTGEHHEAGLRDAFARDAAIRILGEAGVEDGVGDGVAQLVGVAFGDGLG